MTTTLTATYDGEVLRPDEPIELEANTRVRITIETTRPIVKKKRSFLRTALSLNLPGPPIGLLDSKIISTRKKMAAMTEVCLTGN